MSVVLLTTNLVLSPPDRCPADALLPAAGGKGEMTLGGLAAEKPELHPVAPLGLVGDVEAGDVVRLELLAAEEVEEVLDVFHAVQVAVDVEVAVPDPESFLRTTLLHGLDFHRRLDGAQAVGEVRVKCRGIEQRGPTAFEVDSRPCRAGIAEDAPLAVAQFEATVGGESADLTNPRPHHQPLPGAGIDLQLDSEAREDPRRMPSGHVAEAEATR